MANLHDEKVVKALADIKPIIESQLALLTDKDLEEQKARIANRNSGSTNSYLPKGEWLLVNIIPMKMRGTNEFWDKCIWIGVGTDNAGTIHNTSIGVTKQAIYEKGGSKNLQDTNNPVINLSDKDKIMVVDENEEGLKSIYENGERVDYDKTHDGFYYLTSESTKKLGGKASFSNKCHWA